MNSRDTKDSFSNLYNSYNSINDLSDAINSVFCSYFNDSTCYPADFQNLLNIYHTYDSHWELSISEEEICNAFNSYDCHKAYGPDCVPTYLYKKSAHIICKPLAIIFNFCITSKTFPKLWKIAHVIPVPKLKNPSIQDLRPISLLSLPSKIFERFIFNSVSSIFYDNYDDNQYGFRPRSSTCCALIKLHDHITQMLDSSSVSGVQVITLDYRKAFDTLDHKAIIIKLLKCKFPIEFIELICSYLQNRTQSVRINNVISEPGPVTSGIPQGSIIGPPIFSLVMSDLLPIDSSTMMAKFADDVTLSVPIFHTSNHVTTELVNIKSWSQLVGSVLNLSKCKYFFVRSSTNAVPVMIPEFTFCHELKLLGIYFSEDLHWDTHFKHIRSVCHRRLYAIRILKSILTVNELRTVYMTLIVPVIEYCSPLFVGMNQKMIDIISNIERRFHNIICCYNCHCDFLPNLTHRRLLSSVKLFLAASKPNHVINCLIPRKHTRYIQPFAKTERRKRSFVPFTTEIVNNLFHR